MKVDFWDFMSDGTNSSQLAISGTNGVATWNLLYPDDTKAHAFMACVVPETILGVTLPQGIVCNPIQLTVSKTTRILLNTTREGSSLNHTIQGRLMWNSTSVPNKEVKLKINETEYTVTTNDTGHFSKSLDLQPKDGENTTYIITASFADDTQQPLNATAWAKTLDGQDYATCTTIQFGYRPSCNSTLLMVEPQATDTATSKKSPEEMKEEMLGIGWLKVWHGFSWWYPWYRLHINATIEGAAWVHVAFNPVIPIVGGEVQTHGFENLLPPLPSTPMPPSLPPPPNISISDELTTLVLKEFFAFSVPLAAAIATANVPALPAAFAAMLIYGGLASLIIHNAYQTYFSAEWGAHTKASAKLITLMVTLVAAIIGTELSFSAGIVLKAFVVPAISTFLSNLINPVVLQSALNAWWLSSYNALFAGLALLKIPNPSLSNTYFKTAFIVTNVILIGVVFGFLIGWSL